MRLAEFLLGGSVTFVLYTYFGYPVLLWVLARVRCVQVLRGDMEPSVSLIIAAHNEERRIREKLENTLSQDYRSELLEIIVASDCSTDRTDAIALEYRSRGVKLVRTAKRVGKEGAQKQALETSRGDILAFSDTATILPVAAIRTIVRNFHDPSVGCVSSVDRVLTDDGKPGGEGVYVRYEMLLRRLESRIGTVVGLSGSFFAARREICEPWRADLQSDFNTLINAARRHLRGISDDLSVAYYRTIKDPAREYDRKVRTVLRGITVLLSHASLLNPFRYGLFSWELASHKLFRWLVPYALILALAANAVLAFSSRTYVALLSLQGLFYLAAVLGATRRPAFRHPAFVLPAFAVEVNGSIIHAWCSFFRGRRITGWSPSTRDPVETSQKPAASEDSAS